MLFLGNVRLGPAKHPWLGSSPERKVPQASVSCGLIAKERRGRATRRLPLCDALGPGVHLLHLSVGGGLLGSSGFALAPLSSRLRLGLLLGRLSSRRQLRLLKGRLLRRGLLPRLLLGIRSRLRLLSPPLRLPLLGLQGLLLQGRGTAGG